LCYSRGLHISFSLSCLFSPVLFCQIFLDGVPLLDLPGMLQYVSGTNSSGILSGNLENEPAVPLISSFGLCRSFNNLDDEDSPAKTLLSRISNKLVRKVFLSFSCVVNVFIDRYSTGRD
jgi:hypothetical protein